MDPQELKERLRGTARELGFQLFGVAPAARPDTLSAFQHWLDEGLHGELSYMERRRAAYEHPEGVQQGVRSVIMLGAAYEPPPRTPADQLSATPAAQPRIAAYAQGSRDYHDVIRQRLRRLSELLQDAAPGCRTRIAIDTAPLLERDFARRSGLGWFGKNTMLINKRIGSYFFLAGLLTDLALPPDPPHAGQHCGSCTRCLDACPTQAFPAPYVLDARRCISALTIESRAAAFPEELEQQIGNWVFGCDICQEVCPWNRKAPATEIEEFRPLPRWSQPDLQRWFELTPEEFSAEFAGSPLDRPGRRGLLRNATIVLRNLGLPVPPQPE
jgi:epoxyqueuosine reductase